ncbi:MAG TPA: aromatic amino acid aminotransferase, partial [Gammaproteobacteria bacterium]|nr:aromatic amino acid aminotransferase [Gammaproteobacteria bacterium]
AAAPDATVWVSDPTWPVHIPLIGSVGLQFKTYRYYSVDMKGLDFDAMLADLEAAQAGDVVLLHGCCHNPSGADLTQAQWQAIKEVALSQGFTVFIDLAYQGLGDGLEQDVYGVRLLAEALPELIVVSSCSKNFGLYRERTGALTLICENDAAASAATTLLAAAARANYSMPPDHGAAIVQTVMQNPELQADWDAELKEVRDRINSLRSLLVSSLRAAGLERDFSFIEREKGMFSFLGVNKAQIQTLINDYSIYLVGSSRINVASINDSNLDYLVDSVAAVLKS